MSDAQSSKPGRIVDELLAAVAEANELAPLTLDDDDLAEIKQIKHPAAARMARIIALDFPRLGLSKDDLTFGVTWHVEGAAPGIGCDMRQRIDAGALDELQVWHDEAPLIPEVLREDVIQWLAQHQRSHAPGQPAPNHTAWCGGTCEWEWDGGTQWHCFHSAVTATRTIKGRFAVGSEEIVATFALREGYDGATGAVTWDPTGETYIGLIEDAAFDVANLRHLAGLCTAAADKADQLEHGYTSCPSWCTADHAMIPGTADTAVSDTDHRGIWVHTGPDRKHAQVWADQIEGDPCGAPYIWICPDPDKVTDPDDAFDVADGVRAAGRDLEAILAGFASVEAWAEHYGVLERSG